MDFSTIDDKGGLEEGRGNDMEAAEGDDEKDKDT